MPQICTICKYTEVNTLICREKQPNSFLTCSREKGHTGSHIACSIHNHVIDIWINKNKTNTLPKTKEEAEKIGLCWNYQEKNEEKKYCILEKNHKENCDFFI